MFNLSTGAVVPFDADQREVFGTDFVVGAGIAARLGASDAWFFFDSGYQRGSGQELRADPTFAVPDAESWLVPLRVGIRGNVVRPRDFPLAFYLGFAWQTVFTSFQGPFTSADRTPTYGVLLELRPEYRVNARWSVWLRQQLSVMADATYETGFSAMNYSGGQLEIGVGLKVD